MLIGDISFICESQPRRFSCFMVDSSKMHKVLRKAARDKHIESELLLVSLHFTEELESIKTEYGPELDTRLNEIATEFADAP